MEAPFKQLRMTKMQKLAYSLGKASAFVQDKFGSRSSRLFYGRDLSENTSALNEAKKILNEGQITGKKPEYPYYLAGEQ